MLDGWHRLILAGEPVTLPLRNLLISVQEIFCEIFWFQKNCNGTSKRICQNCATFYSTCLQVQIGTAAFRPVPPSAHLKFMTSIVACLLPPLLSGFWGFFGAHTYLKFMIQSIMPAFISGCFWGRWTGSIPSTPPTHGPSSPFISGHRARSFRP